MATTRARRAPGREGGPRTGPSRRGLRRTLTTLSAFVVVGVTVVAVLLMVGGIRRAQRGFQSAVALEHLDAHVAALGTAESQAIERGRLAGEWVAAAHAREADTRALLHDLRGHVDPRTWARIDRLVTGFSGDVEETLALFRAGKIDEAHAFDDGVLEPRATDISDLLATEIARATVSAKHADAAAQRTAWLVIPGVIALIGFLLLAEERGRQRAAVAESEQRGKLRFRSLVQHSSDVVSIVDASGIVTYCSPSVHDVLGFDPSEQESFDIIHRLVHPDDEPHVLQMIANMLGNPGSSVEIECRVRHADGGWRMVDNVLTNLLDDPLLNGFVMNTRDVTAKREVETALRRREASFRLLFEANPEPMWVYDRETLRFLEVNTAAVEKYGWSAQEFKRMRITDIRPEEDRERVVRHVRGRTSDLRRSGPWRHRLAGGREILVELASHALDFAGRPAALVLAFDVTEQVALQAELKHAAFHDSLTGLANRALFHDRVDHALDVSRRHPHEIAVLFVDLDGFKTVNESLGHAVGDALLMGVAERFAACLRPGDTIARLGGDEFGVLLEDVTDPSVAIGIAQRMLHSLEEPFDLAGTETFVSASVGIRLSDTSTASAGTLLRDADAAMYAAKSSGNGRFRLFETEMHESAVEDLELRAELQRALQRDQFVLHYQPVVGLTSGRVEGFEALIRWQHPERGLVPPGVFVPAAEETGLITPIGRWALEEACAQARTWHDRHRDAGLSMAVNVSVRQLRGTHLVDDVRHALETSGIDARTLVLEITESTLVDDVDDVVRQLAALKQLGVRIAVDDFGTGYSSLSYLRRLPIDVLKIDRSFVEGVLGDDSEGTTFVRSIVDLAHSLGLQTVAEGVEKREQLEQLRRVGCDVAQGFHLAPPASAGAVQALLDSLGPQLTLLGDEAGAPRR